MSPEMKNRDLKRRIIEISYPRKLSHLGSNLGSIDIIEGIYRMKEPDNKFVLDCGHAHLAHLVVMEKYGVIQSAEKMLDKYGIHCDIKAGCDASTGSLGLGLPIALGMALSNREKNVYCLLSDGGAAEGSIMEALQIKEEMDVHNLKVYLSNNGFGAYKETEGIYEYKHFGVRVINTESEFPFLKGIAAHYSVMDKTMYKKALRILDD